MRQEHRGSDPVPGRRTGGGGNDHRTVLSAGTLIGEEVKNPQGEKLGKIEEIMLDQRTGRIAYAVLSFGGVMGIGDKLIALPWDTLQLDQEDEAFILNTDKEVLEAAPGFDKNNWPDFADPQWNTEMYNYFGSTPYWQ